MVGVSARGVGRPPVSRGEKSLPKESYIKNEGKERGRRSTADRRILVYYYDPKSIYI